MKKVNLVLQSKGGVGKSLFLWFVAQVERDNPTAFIDLDESTQTSSARLGSVVGQERVKHFKILNENKKLEREKILNLFETLAKSKTDKWFIDFGAPESEEFRKLLEFDINVDLLVSELERIGIKLTIYIILAGKDALVSCLNYYNAFQNIVGNKISILALMNEGTFGGLESIQSGHQHFIDAKIPFKSFGGLGDSESGKDVIMLVTEQKDPATLNFAGRLTYNKALDMVKKIID